MSPLDVVVSTECTYHDAYCGSECEYGQIMGQPARFKSPAEFVEKALNCGNVTAGLIVSGTSWGTFGILIPIAIAVIGTGDQNLLVITVAAILSGAVGGDHASPISDTTILASAGAQCSHIDHVSTQIPYVAIVARIPLVSDLLVSFTLII